MPTVKFSTFSRHLLTFGEFWLFENKESEEDTLSSDDEVDDDELEEEEQQQHLA